MRKAKPKKRYILPDPKFNDTLVTRFVNCLMVDGKKSIAYREIKFPVTTPGCGDTLAYVSLTGNPAKQLESVLRPGSVIEVQGWIKPGKEWKYKNNKKFLVDALLITLGSKAHGGSVKLIKR